MRRAKGLSQPELAAKMGVSTMAIAIWESTNTVPQRRLLLKVAAALETTPGCLYSGEIGAAAKLPILDAHLDELVSALAALNAVGAQLLRAVEKMRPKTKHALPGMQHINYYRRRRRRKGT